MRVPERIGNAIVVGVISLYGVWAFFVPWFGGVPSAPAGGDYLNHVALVAAAIDTIRETGGIPISTDKLIPGYEYPYFLLGNFAFDVLAAYVSALSGSPAYVGVFVVLAATFVAGVAGMYAIARRHRVTVVAALLGFLYASGPYLSLNLFIRDAYPEYMMWQLLPCLYLLVQRSLRSGAGPAWVLVGAVALAAPFWVHKLVAPYAILTLLASVFYRYRPDARLIVRTGLIGVIALLLSAPPWLAMRGIVDASFQIRGPAVYSHDLLNYLWPYLQSSLKEEDGAASYRFRFGLQVGLIPAVGCLLAVLSLVVCWTVGNARRVAVLLLVFGLATSLVLDSFGFWESTYVPTLMRGLELSYRLIGIAHFVGFLALCHALRVLRRPAAPAWLGRVAIALQVLLSVVAALAASTYWHAPDYRDIAPASITPAHLVDLSRLYLKPTHGNLDVGRAVGSDNWLVVPPSMVPIDTPSDVVVLTGTTAPPVPATPVGARSIRVYGFTNDRPGEAARRANLRDFLEGRWRALGDEDPVARRARQLGVDAARGPVPLGTAGWEAVLLGEQTVPPSREIELRVPTGPGIRAIAVTCSWSDVARQVEASLSAERRICLKVRVLAAGENGGDYVDPRPIPASLRTRLPYGTSVIDAHDLPSGHYLLPSMRYHFLRVRTERGEIVPTYEYDGRPVVRHAGGVQSYVVEYDLRPELLTMAAGLAVFAIYAVASILLRRRASRRCAGGASASPT